MSKLEYFSTYADIEVENTISMIDLTPTLYGMKKNFPNLSIQIPDIPSLLDSIGISISINMPQITLPAISIPEVPIIPSLSALVEAELAEIRLNIPTIEVSLILPQFGITNIDIIDPEF